ncbi:DNA/RNA polymerase [Coniochaeta ligniaria NRRL 30616]|uniref:DNA/RNA polymerase n=1 Tax=Coniochaeta ligniaria NRRL 30616 TaxID=1408157 RepID=A0A1J7IEF6_9PEZI|nr:DNA/RNA polymerase [Coniochaeta ligniaria NRRL 30616]
MHLPRPKPPRRRDDRIILHFDYDCFYAQVVENRQPALKSLPLGIKQKSILATCNYVARRRGVTKLMGISDAKKICPDLVLVDGEDLSTFRDVSKKLYHLLRSYSWNGKIERLGLDEVFLDVTDIVAYNVELLNPHALDQSFFCLSKLDPELGFSYDATAIAGCTHGSPPPADQRDEDFSMYLRLLAASHLARYLRLKIEEEGYTSACGISSNKVLSKLVGTVNKPRDQTAFLAFREEDIWSFMDAHNLRRIPGIGNRISSVLEAHILAAAPDPNFRSFEATVSAGRVRTHPDMSAPVLEKLLGGPGAEKGIGEKVWCLLHGVDNSPIKAASDIPTQISIEDTYQGLNDMAEIDRQLRLLSASLLRRMYIDLVEEVVENSASPQPSSTKRKRWLAHPKTIRLTTRPYFRADSGKPYNYARVSRSQQLPNFVFSFASAREVLVDKLVDEVLLPMFRGLNPATKDWNVGLLNVCVANMVVVGGENGGIGGGRDIGAMFRRQEDVLREFRVYDDDDGVDGVDEMRVDGTGDDAERDEEDSDAEPWEEDDRDGLECCARCGHLIPGFALIAHERYHDLEPV